VPVPPERTAGSARAVPLFGPPRSRRRYGSYSRSRGRGGFYGPFPYYSRRTRGGSRVTVSGCCLPIPFGVLTVAGLAAQRLYRR
jgi:hypothetical protein